MIFKKRKLRKLLHAFGFSFLLGFLIWLLLFRVVTLEVGSNKKYALILLTDANNGDEVVFKYPSYAGDYSSSVLKKTFPSQNKVFIEGAWVLLQEDLIVGKILFKFM